MAVLLGLIAVFVLFYQFGRLRRDVDRLQEELATLGRRVERLRRAQDAASRAVADRTAGDAETEAPEVAEKPAPWPEPRSPRPLELWRGEAASAGRKPAEGAPPPPPPVPGRAGAAFAAGLGASAARSAAAGRAGEAGAGRPVAPGAGQPAAAAEGADLETRLGTTWTLRIGLGAITVAAGLFARTIVPSLSPAVKVVLAYAGALALVAVGRVFEDRLARFGRPVMAGGLAIGFFVSFAAYFVPAMRAVPLAASLIWMVAGVIAILALATRWRSEPTAGLAILLGHLSAYVAAGDADRYSLVVVLFLSVAAVVLLWRHAWLPLSLVAVVAAYGSHLLWGIADRPGAPGERAMQLSMLFLSSYYAVFLAADLLWWRRRPGAAAGGVADPVRALLARSLGPVNVVLYATIAAFLYFATGQPGSLTPYLFGIGVMQLALTLVYRRLGNVDWALYPALGTIFITTGFASALDALSLDVVLAAEALVLLLAAQRTRLRVFHVLAQSVLAASFAHYFWVPPQPPALGLFLGGALIALVYFTQATLEERWYGGTAGGWQAGAAPAGLAGLVAAWFDAGFRRAAPYLAHAHAAAGALILARETERFLSPAGATVVLLGTAAALAAAAVVRRSVPLLLGYGITHAGAIAAALSAPPGWEWGLLAAAAASLLLPLGLLAAARRALGGAQLTAAALIGHATAATALLLLRRTGDAGDSLTFYLATIGGVAFVFLYADAARGGYAHASAGVAAVGRRFGALTGLAAAAVVVDATAELVGPTLSAQRGAWLTGWAAVLLVAAGWRRDPGFYLAGFALLVVGSILGWLGAATGPVGAMLLIAAVPLVLAVVQDHGGVGRLRADEGRLATATSAIAYLLGTAVLWTFFLARIDEPWYLLAVAGTAAGVHLVNQRAPASTGRDIAILLMFVVLFVQLTSVVDPLAAGTLDLLGCALLVAAAALLLERLSALAPPGSELPSRYTGTALVAAAAGVALVALDSSVWRGGAFATVGYSITGAVLMTLGFVARSASHRRIALAVFALTLGRLFIVDTRGLSDGGRTLAFLVLGVSLVAVAWLYSRFAARIRQWL